MEIAEKKNSLCICLVLLACGVMLMAAVAEAAAPKENQAPGRSMAQQATKSKKLWRTSDHSKHKVLQKDFISGAELDRKSGSAEMPRPLPYLVCRLLLEKNPLLDCEAFSMYS